jgi:hypothetical protein
VRYTANVSATFSSTAELPTPFPYLTDAFVVTDSESERDLSIREKSTDYLLDSEKSTDYLLDSEKSTDYLLIREKSTDYLLDTDNPPHRPTQVPYVVGRPTTTKNNRIVRLSSPLIFKRNINIFLTERELPEPTS